MPDGLGGLRQANGGAAQRRLPNIAGARADGSELRRLRAVDPPETGTEQMDHQTRHEIWIVTAASLAPIPLLTALAVVAALH
jgi:hypothetical protein